MASVDHKYCLQLSALCMAEPVKMITQLMPHGSAVSFLQKHKHDLFKYEKTEEMLLTWSQQIAEGMCYLESMGIVHRDLAARNILVKSRMHIKITDFGLSRIIEPTEDGFYATKNTLVPVKWLAIESIRHRLFNHKSDVWAYAVCLWELFTFCARPYAEIESVDVANSIIKGIYIYFFYLGIYHISLSILQWILNQVTWVKKSSLHENIADISKLKSKLQLNTPFVKSPQFL